MYDLKSVSLPILSGVPLKMVRALLEYDPTFKLLAPALLRDAGVQAYRAQSETAPALAEPADTEWEAAPRAEPRTIQVAGHMEAEHVCSIQQLHDAYVAGETTPTAVVEALIAARGTSAVAGLNAHIAYDDDALRADAAAASERYRTGTARGLLDGVPISVKDEFAVANYRTGAGTSFFQTAFRGDATPVAQARANGALIIGKAQMHEIGLGVTGTNVHYGPARNPVNPAYSAGGSSGGPAAAVASGQALIGLGADGGGSIRLPASFCGIYGLKPTYRRISSHGGAGAVWSMSHPGPLTATAADLDLAMQVLVGGATDDASVSQRPYQTADVARRDLRGVSIGYMPEWFEHADTEIVAACRSMLHYFRSAGADVREINVPGLEAARVAHTIIITTEILQSLAPFYAQSRQQLSDETRLSLAISRAFDEHDINHARQTRHHFTQTLKQIFAHVDVLATPTCGLLAPTIEARSLPHGKSDLGSTFEMMRFAFAANLSGIPAISMPAGYAKNRLPIGFQLMARPWQEHTLIEAACVAQQWTTIVKPQVWHSLSS